MRRSAARATRLESKSDRQRVATAWAEQQPLTARKKLLLMAIAHETDKSGTCRSLTQEDLAASCDCTVRQVRRLIKELAHARYLAHRSCGALGGGRGADFYVLPREARPANSETKMSALVETESKPDI